MKDSSVVDIEFKKAYINNKIFDVIRDDEGNDKNRKRARFSGISEALSSSNQKYKYISDSRFREIDSYENVVDKYLSK